jgi:hypothetical protein
MRLTRAEEGDLGYRTKYSIKHQTTWETDRFGYRVRGVGPKPDVVVVGDSLVVGNGASQEDTLAEVLRTKFGENAYPFAPRSVAAFLAEPRFRANPPRFVITERVERYVATQPSWNDGYAVIDRRGLEVPRTSLAAVQVSDSTFLRYLELALLRAYRMNAVRWMRSAFTDVPVPVVAKGMAFLTDGTAPPPAREQLELAAESLSGYADLIRARGSRVAVMIVPNKETAFFDLLPGARQPHTIEALNQALEKRGVEVLDLGEAFATARQRGARLYIQDDTHWDRSGVEVAASLIQGWMRHDPGSSP